MDIREKAAGMKAVSPFMSNCPAGTKILPVANHSTNCPKTLKTTFFSSKKKAAATFPWSESVPTARKTSTAESLLYPDKHERITAARRCPFFIAPDATAACKNKAQGIFSLTAA